METLAQPCTYGTHCPAQQRLALYCGWAGLWTGLYYCLERTKTQYSLSHWVKILHASPHLNLIETMKKLLLPIPFCWTSKGLENFHKNPGFEFREVSESLLSTAKLQRSMLPKTRGAASQGWNPSGMEVNTAPSLRGRKHFSIIGQIHLSFRKTRLPTLICMGAEGTGTILLHHSKWMILQADLIVK